MFSVVWRHCVFVCRIWGASETCGTDRALLLSWVWYWYCRLATSHISSVFSAKKLLTSVDYKKQHLHTTDYGARTTPHWIVHTDKYLMCIFILKTCIFRLTLKPPSQYAQKLSTHFAPIDLPLFHNTIASESTQVTFCKGLVWLSGSVFALNPCLLTIYT